jgi:DNA-binding MarR family transcriptional regulator
LHVLRLINTLGPNATLSAIAKTLDRKLDVITKQAALMEKNGLIKRTIARPKSRLFKIELTSKGHELLHVDRYSDAMNEALSILSREELLQLDSVLDRILTKLKQYDPENATKKLF